MSDNTIPGRDVEDPEVPEPTVVEPESRPAPDTAPDEWRQTADATPADSVPPVAGAGTGEVDPLEPAVVTPAPAAAGAKVVYVQAASPPQPKGNRGVGVLLALLGAVIFAVAYFGVVSALAWLSVIPDSPAEFVRSSAFWVPVLFFALGFVLIVLLLNRAAWWAHVLGSIIVALIVYFGTIGVLLLVDNAIALTPDEANALFSDLALSPVVIAAALVAREVSIWVGFLIAVRGRKVVTRNAEARAAFDAEQAQKQADYERTAAQS